MSNDIEGEETGGEELPSHSRRNQQPFINPPLELASERTKSPTKAPHA